MKKLNVCVTDKQKGSDRLFKGYGGHSLTVLGTFNASLEVAGRSVETKFYVIKGAGKFLIGRETAMQLGILKIETAVNQVSGKKGNVFGKIKGFLVDIPMKANTKPVIQGYRRVSVPLEKKVDKKIDELLEQGIIEKVNGPSKWISPLVIVPKANSDEIRVCVDMRRANECVERENHPLPTIDDFLPHLAKAKYYSKIDIKNAFHQVR